MTTLEEAMAGAGGDERPFHCPAHEDHNASASVNVAKGVWCCHACGASGKTEGTKVLDTEALGAMFGSEPAYVLSERVIPFWTAIPNAYWMKRFHHSVCRYFSLGSSPISGLATYPVRYSDGRLAGFVTRNAEMGQPKYVYPKGWSSSRTLFRSARTRGVVLVVEGATDVMALAEAGISAVGIFGSRLHAPQAQLISEMNPRLLLAGTDTDLAGDNGFRSILRWFPQAVRVFWGAKDPGEMSRTDRYEQVLGYAAHAGYGHVIEENRAWWRETYRDRKVMGANGYR